MTTDKQSFKACGNKFWNNATDNKSKSIISLSRDEFESIRPKLDDIAMNYYAVIGNSSVRLAVNDSTLELFKRVTGIKDLQAGKSSKEYTPKAMNIAENCPFRYIPQKSYHYAETDLALKLVDELNNKGIKFSSRVYSATKTTITVSKEDLSKLKDIENEIKQKRDNIPKPKILKYTAIGTIPFSSIKNRHLYTPNVSAKEYRTLEPYMQELDMKFFGIILDNNIHIVLEEDNSVEFYQKLEIALNRRNAIENLQNNGFSNEQIEVLKPTLYKASEIDQESMFTIYLNPRYTNEQLLQIAEQFEKYLALPLEQRVFDPNGDLSKLIQMKSDMDLSILASDFCNKNNIDMEKKDVIFNGMKQGLSIETLEENIDNSYTAEEISAYINAFVNADLEELNKVIKEHNKTVFDNSLNSDAFMNIAQEQLVHNRLLRSTFENSDEENFRIEIRSQVDKLLTEIISGNVDIGFSKEMIAPFYNDFQSNAWLRESVYDNVGLYLSGVFREVIKARDFAEENGIPFSDNLISDVEAEPSIYVYDGSMSPKDFRKMQLLNELSEITKTEDSTPYRLIEAFEKYGSVEAWCNAENDEFMQFRELTEKAFKVISESDYIKEFHSTINDELQTIKSENPQIQAAFSNLIASNKYSDKQIEVLSRAAKQLEINGYEKLEPGLFNTPLFSRNYGGFVKINDKIFNGGLMNVINKINADLNVSTVAKEDEREITVDNIDVGDKFLYKGREYTIESMQGIYHDEVVVSRTENSGGLQYSVTQNIDVFELIREGEYLGNSDKSIEPVSEEVNLISDSTTDPDSELPPQEKIGSDLAVGDVIRYEDKRYEVDDKDTAYYCDSFGFTEMPDFFLEKERTQEKSAPSVADLEVGDIIMYDGARREIEEISTDRIKMKDLDAPDYGGILIGTSDVLAYDGWQEDMESKGFEILSKAEKSEPEFSNDLSNTDDQLSLFDVEKEEKTEPAPSNDFTITDDNLGEGGAKSKFKANINAVQTLKQIEAENRSATPAEREIMSKYVGWGGLANAFDSNRADWNAEYTQLKELLTDSEYSSARASTLDAFYTSPTIIDGIYEALSNFGFEGGNVLEPALGVGNFLGRMPQEMFKNSKIYGTEIDSISGRIAQKLYPNADIKVEGFEKNKYQEGCFDVAVGNVPFGDLSFKDVKHGTTKLHDYFFAETLDKIKAGGIVAFVTSTGTLDKKDETVRKMLAEKADLIGAVRLPSGAFKANAGTDVTSDIIFLQKRNTPPTEVPEWVHIGESDNGLPINSYFTDHSDMILGDLVVDTNPMSSGTKVVPIEGKDLKGQLSEAVRKLTAGISKTKAAEVYNFANTEIVDVDSVRNMSFFKQNDRIFYKGIYGEISETKSTDKNFNKISDFIDLRNCVADLLSAQELDRSDEEIKNLQAKLNTLYDKFSENHGILHSISNKKALKEDVAYPLVCALESKIENGKVTQKSDIFTKRTICPAKAAEHVDTAVEALTLSMAEQGKVDFEYMQSLTDLSKEDLLSELKNEIFPIPASNEYQCASEYLSGDIRKKISLAKSALENGDSRMEENIKALQEVMPEPLKAADIDVKIGASWINPKYYEQFMYETFGTPDLYREDGHKNIWQRYKPKNITVEYSEHTENWSILNKRADLSVTVTKEFGTKKMNAYQIFENLLNLKEPKINKTIYKDGKEQRVPDLEATKNAQRKAAKIRKAFKDWIFESLERRNDIVATYNEKFNSIRPREYDGSALRFPGMNAEIKLHSHQKNAIAHAMFGGNTLFAHAVGAGKTYEMIASAMESKRLGLCTKSLFAVPNHLTEQIGEDFRKLYPNANILVAEKSDFKKENRQALFGKIAAGNFDAVIIGHSQLGMIKMSKERRENILQEQISDILKGIEDLKRSEGSNFQIKSMERTRKSLQKNLETLQKEKQDDTVTFEQMGIDKLFVDEAHEFKNLFTPTKLQNLSGISNSASQKAMDLFMKCRYLDEKTGGRGVCFATGTPLSNSVTELHTMMRYLEYDFLKEKGLQSFDNWITVFGEQKTDWELAPAGNKFRQKTRIANYTGLPELVSMFKQVADIRTADTLKLDVPECETHIVNVEATDLQKELVEELSDRADDVQDNKVDPTVDNMLKITSDGRKLGLDPRLINPKFEDDPNTKLNKCVENVSKIYDETSAEKSAQIIFCDLGVPHSEKNFTDKNSEEKSSAERESLEEVCDFCVYDDIKQKLINKGIPENEIAYIHSAKTEKQKSELFDKVRKGEVRVLLGSTSKMGTGTNVQDKLIAVHDLDIPWRPADLEQRMGRVVRQGNENEKVHVYRYVTKGTFDAYSYQTLENKQKFISQIMTSKTPVRKCEDVDQSALSYGEIKALCTGDERIKEKMTLENEVKDLRFEKSEYQNNRYELQDKVRKFPQEKALKEKVLDNLNKDLEHIKGLEIDPITEKPRFEITIGETSYIDKTEAAKALEKACTDLVNIDEPTTIGRFQGFPLNVYFKSAELSENSIPTLTAELSGAVKHICEFTNSFPHNIKKLENLATCENLERRISKLRTSLAAEQVDYESAQKILAMPFAHEEELSQKEERLEQLTEELNNEAIMAKKEKNGKQRTFYFKAADFAKQLRNQPQNTKKTQDKDKSNHKNCEVCVE